ncbi:MAG: hypothetical protein EBX52_11960 [Proteobacteria bacterium]|nr:hypothetical protein [Pseudomonadota bacterium]
MTRDEKLELIQRVLGLKHKLKVLDSMKMPETHDELSISLLARWELEDEIRAIEALLDEERNANVRSKRTQVEAQYLSGSLPPKKNK